MLPATLTGDERQVVVLLYLDFSQAEIARLLGVRPRDIGVRVASVREKMADWRPDATSMSQPTVKVQLASEAWALIEAVATPYSRPRMVVIGGLEDRVVLHRTAVRSTR
jgi:hypothetical protein